VALAGGSLAAQGQLGGAHRRLAAGSLAAHSRLTRGSIWPHAHPRTVRRR
jgi:hypothetical protein